ncbi:MAG: peptidylprolyl isomerase [Longimicrobiales bacterium]
MTTGIVRQAGRLALGLALVGAAACDTADAPDAAGEPSSRPVAQVGDWRLDSDRLADLLVLGQPLPLDTATVTALVREWMERAAGMQRDLRGDDLLGGEALEASIWLEERQALLDAARRARGGDSAPSLAAARAEFESDSLRLLAHVLRAVDASTSPAEIDLQRRTAREILDGLLDGGPWPEAVARSEDPLTRDDLGVLGLLRVDELPPELQPVAARLQPGQVSAVVAGPAGFHILYRPSFADAGERYRTLLAARRREAADQRVNQAVRDSLDPALTEGALPRVRDLLAGGPALIVDPEAVVTYDGGAFDGTVLRRYLATLPPEDRASLATAPDGALTDFLLELAARDHRVRQARAAGIEPDSAALARLEALHRDEIGRWRSALPTDGGPEAARDYLARSMEALVSRRSTVPPLVPLLRAWMLAPWDTHLDPEALEAAAERARAMVAAASEGR